MGNLGTLVIKTSGKEDIAAIVHVDNNDDNLVNELVNLRTLNNKDYINAFDTSGNDLSITSVLQKVSDHVLDIDAEESRELIFVFEDSGIALKAYDIKIQLEYEEEEPLPPYEEVAGKNDLERQAAEVLSNKKSEE